MVAHGLPIKIIARDTGMAVDTVRVHVKAAAAKIPGPQSPRQKLALWFFGLTQSKDGGR